MVSKPLTMLCAGLDAESLRLNRRIAKELGCAIHVAATGLECLRLAKEQRPDILLVAVDLTDIDGMEICRRIRSDQEINQIQILLVSQFQSPKLAQAAVLDSGADAFLTVPYPPDELRMHLRSMERRKRKEEDLRGIGAALEQQAKKRTAELEQSNTVLQSQLSELRRMEEAIRSSELFFREVTENSSDIILILDRKGLVTYASPSVERFLGYRPEEMLGKSSFRFIHEADVGRARIDFAKAVRSPETAVPNSFRVIRKDGTECTLEGLGRNLLHNPTIAGFIMNVHDVSERRLMEEASRLFAHTLESITEIVTITDLEDRFTFVNKAFTQTYGYTSQEIIGRHPEILWSPNNPDGLLRGILEQNRSTNWSGELLNITKDGREFPISLHTSRIRNDHGEVIGLVGVSEDITERRKAEEALRQSEAKYRDLVEQISDVIFATDMNGTFTYISPMAELLSGYKPAEMIGHSVAEFVDPPFLPKILERYKRSGVEHLEPIEYRVKAKWGKLLWVRSSSRIVFEGKKPIGMRGVLTDITTQKIAQENVVMLSHTIKSISECVCITDHRNNILFVNKAFLDTYGYSEEELLGKSVDIINPAPRTVRTVLGETLDGGWQGELINRKKDGTEFPVFLSTSVVRDELGQAIALVGVATDITERKNFEEELSRQKKDLQTSYEQLRQLEVARDTLLHMIVHDMRSRLFAMMMGLEFIENHEIKSFKPPSRQVLSQALQSSKVLIEMVNSLLDISRMEAGEMKLKLLACDLVEIARKLIPLFDLQKENRQITINAPPQPVIIVCDADVITRVIQNLLSNALKFTAHDGAITITILGTEKGATVSVHDSGQGIAPQDLTKIFDKFYQAQARGDSTGLGLTFCKLAVELHGGQIGVESEIGMGSTFWFTLPSAAEY
ncbi:MAG TPA: PAS domain S-box protein [Bacteroidota bacterium]|nr:PAS domain S-box protein [Bacteroidota bacterium]